MKEIIRYDPVDGKEYKEMVEDREVFMYEVFGGFQTPLDIAKKFLESSGFVERKSDEEVAPHLVHYLRMAEEQVRAAFMGCKCSCCGPQSRVPGLIGQPVKLR